MKRIALIGDNSIEFVSLLVDLWNDGHCVVLIDWRIPPQAMIEMIKEANVHKCYIQSDFLERFSLSEICDVQFIPYEKKKRGAETLPQEIYDKYAENYSHEEAVVIYSSGTTGRAKGIVLSHFAITTNAEAIIDYMKPRKNDCLYIIKTLVHSSTLTGELLVALKTKTPVIIGPVIIPPRIIFNTILKNKVTILCLNPVLLSIIMGEYERQSYNISSLKKIYVSGSILSNDLFNKVHTVFYDVKVYNVYGLSEAGPRVTAQREDCCRGNSVGRPVTGVEVAVVDHCGNDVPCGERGIIHIKTPSIFSYYISGDIKHRSLRSGWHNTGDVGYWDKEGELRIVGRLDDMIIIDSHKIYPADVEEKIMDTGLVEECVVVKMNTTTTEYIGCLYRGKSNSQSDLRLHLSKVLMTHEIPRCFIKCEIRLELEIGKISEQICALREQLDISKKQMTESERVSEEIEDVKTFLENAEINFVEYDEIVVRKLVECIRVMAERKIVIILKGGVTIEVQIM